RDQEGREEDVMDGLELLLVELALVLLLALLSMSEAALHAIRRPQVVEDLVQRGRRGQRAGRMGERRVRYLAAVQVFEFFALVAVLFFLTRIVTAPFGADPREGTLISEEDIKAIIETGEQQGVLDVEERDMIHSVFALGEKKVHEVMVPRTDIVAIDVNTPPQEG